MKKLLVVVDMQKDFIDGSLGSIEAQAIVPKIIDKIGNIGKSTGVVFTRDTHGNDYMETREGRFLPVPHCIEGTEGWNINKEIYLAFCSNKNKAEVNIGRNKIITINKPTFGSTDLPNVIYKLIEDGLQEVELVGVCTDICVISNAIMIKTFLPETEIAVDASCCAGVTPEKHKAALEVMKSLQINIINE